MGRNTAGTPSNCNTGQPCTDHSSSPPLSNQLAPANGIATSGNDAAAGVKSTGPSMTAEGSPLDFNNTHKGAEASLQEMTAPRAAAADSADAAAAGATACTEDTTSVFAATTHHTDCPFWLPDQLCRVQQQYAAAGHGAGLAGEALVGQRVAFALLEDFHQRDSRQEVDTLLAGLHTGQYASCPCLGLCSHDCPCVMRATDTFLVHHFHFDVALIRLHLILYFSTRVGYKGEERKHHSTP